MGNDFKMVWGPYEPLRVYAPAIRQKFREEAQFMLDDLKRKKSRVDYVRIQREDVNYECNVVRRVVTERSPKWYVEFWARYRYSLRRKGNPDQDKKYDRARGPKNSAIQRRRFENALERIIDGTDRASHRKGRVVELTFYVGRRKYNGATIPHHLRTQERIRTIQRYNTIGRRARQLIYERLVQGCLYEGHWVLPDRRVRNYFGVPLPPNHSEMVADNRRMSSHNLRRQTREYAKPRGLDEVPF
ncbi:hypothetical protein J4447_03760 [Candidatus Pacearchaeota archaeon]|nr:hypothetical protein [Candidatus Pacearchaeota archaeon]